MLKTYGYRVKCVPILRPINCSSAILIRSAELFIQFSMRNDVKAKYSDSSASAAVISLLTSLQAWLTQTFWQATDSSLNDAAPAQNATDSQPRRQSGNAASQPRSLLVSAFFISSLSSAFLFYSAQKHISCHCSSHCVYICSTQKFPRTFV